MVNGKVSGMVWMSGLLETRLANLVGSVEVPQVEMVNGRVFWTVWKPNSAMMANNA